MPKTSDESPLEPVGFLLASRNLFALVFLAQIFLLINGDYLYGIPWQTAIVYAFCPMAMIFYLLYLTKMDNGKPLSWERLERSMMPKRDPLSKYLRAGGFLGGYHSLAVQLIYFALAFGVAYVAFIIAAMEGYIQPQSIDPVSARAAIIVTVILVAPSEEIMFRAAVPVWFDNIFARSKRQEYITFIGSQALFAVFHIAAYASVMGSMAFAFAFGIVLLFIARYMGGLPASMGVHAAWNLVVLGVGSAPLIGA